MALQQQQKTFNFLHNWKLFGVAMLSVCLDMNLCVTDARRRGKKLKLNVELTMNATLLESVMWWRWRPGLLFILIKHSHTTTRREEIPFDILCRINSSNEIVDVLSILKLDGLYSFIHLFTHTRARRPKNVTVSNSLGRAQQQQQQQWIKYRAQIYYFVVLIDACKFEKWRAATHKQLQGKWHGVEMCFSFLSQNISSILIDSIDH